MNRKIYVALPLLRPRLGDKLLGVGQATGNVLTAYLFASEEMISCNKVTVFC